MNLAWILFSLLALVVAGSALAVVLTRNIVRCAVWLLFCLIGVALLYLFLGAEFVGAAQLIVYVGGTLVLVVFGVMLTAQAPFLQLSSSYRERGVAALLALALFGLLATISLELAQSPPPANTTEPLPGVAPLGMAFLGVTQASPQAPLSGLPQDHPPVPRQRVAYLLPFEILSVHLLVVLIAAAYLARAKRRPSQAPSPATAEETPVG